MNEIGHKITEKIIEIHGSDNFTIGFLPYKRSMWNCMESVYQECLKTNAEACILPLPYYLMPEKTIVSELDLFPDNALGISMLEKISFDYLVIHYPYDGNNKVTSMLPRYYTAELKQYGEIIYIPYTCTGGRQFHVQPGIANVDYAFLPSEAEAEAFVREWAELGVDFSGSVFGFGSPKMDSARKCSCGSATLIVNSLAPFLYAPFIKLDTYRRIMEEELAAGNRVIFRPHPLLRQTIKSMRPDTEAAYEDLLSWIHMHNVDLDESEYLEKAFEETNLLISDPSSVLQMWQSTGREYRVIP